MKAELPLDLPPIEALKTFKLQNICSIYSNMHFNHIISSNGLVTENTFVLVLTMHLVMLAVKM